MTMSGTTTYTAIALFGSFWGLFQSVIWTIMAFTAIIWHAVASYSMNINLNTDTYEKILNSYLFESLIKIRDTNSGMYVQPNLFFGAMIFYLLTHTMWGASSVLLYFSTKRNFGMKANFYILTSWIIASCLILALDIVLFALFLRDYKYCVDAYNDTLDATYKLPYLFSITTYGIMMVIAARGFIIWIMNFIITAILIKFCINIKLSNQVATVQQSLYGTVPRDSLRVEELPEETINRVNNDVPIRRRTEPPVRVVSPSPTSTISPTPSSSEVSFKLPRIISNGNGTGDPNVETRLGRYSITPIPSTVGGPS